MAAVQMWLMVGFHMQHGIATRLELRLDLSLRLGGLPQRRISLGHLGRELAAVSIFSANGGRRVCTTESAIVQRIDQVWKLLKERNK